LLGNKAETRVRGFVSQASASSRDESSMGCFFRAREAGTVMTYEDEMAEVVKTNKAMAAKKYRRPTYVRSAGRGYLPTKVGGRCLTLVASTRWNVPAANPKVRRESS